MTEWILVLMVSTGVGISIERQEGFKDFSTCFEERDRIVFERGRPIVDYQVVCVNTNKK